MRSVLLDQHTNQWLKGVRNLMRVDLIWFDLIWFDLIWFDLVKISNVFWFPNSIFRIFYTLHSSLLAFSPSPHLFSPNLFTYFYFYSLLTYLAFIFVLHILRSYLLVKFLTRNFFFLRFIIGLLLMIFITFILSFFHFFIILIRIFILFSIGSILYFAAAGLSSINSMYETSLDSFLSVFKTALISAKNVRTYANYFFLIFFHFFIFQILAIYNCNMFNLIPEFWRTNYLFKLTLLLVKYKKYFFIYYFLLINFTVDKFTLFHVELSSLHGNNGRRLYALFHFIISDLILYDHYFLLFKIYFQWWFLFQDVSLESRMRNMIDTITRQIYDYTCTGKHTHIHTYMRGDIHIHIHAHIHTHIHTHTHTHTHTPSLSTLILTPQTHQ